MENGTYFDPDFLALICDMKMRRTLSDLEEITEHCSEVGSLLGHHWKDFSGYWGLYSKGSWRLEI